MREIKFRAWNTKSGRFAKDGELFLVIDSENYNLYSVDFDNFRLENDNYILMQSTGLKDKNGKEIYEYSELDGAYEVIFKDLKYSLRHIYNNDISGLQDYWRDKYGEIEVTREYTKV